MIIELPATCLIKMQRDKQNGIAFEETRLLLLQFLRSINHLKEMIYIGL